MKEIKIRISIAELEQASACSEGLDYARALAAAWGDPSGTEITWSPLAQVWALTSPWRHWWRWALNMAILPAFSLRSANLSDADLSGANLSGANLSGADLRDADLRDADLRSANLRDANLSDADLSGANLCDADLSGANLRSADLRDANLSDANLYDANLRSSYRPDDPPAGWVPSASGHLQRTEAA